MKRGLFILFILLFNLNFIFADCGNGILELGEQCDDGNRITHDGCSYSCYNETYSSTYCGDGRLFIGKEECDDKNKISGDRCSSTCKNETYDVSMCGDSVLFFGYEECDLGVNGIIIDGCDDDCTFATYNTSYCGDNVIFIGTENCDDGNFIAGDSCAPNCTKEVYDYKYCGDNVLFLGKEQCDDGNHISRDSCSSNCYNETYSSSYCGDGRLFIGKEECDDRNKISYDGCSSTCNNETYYVNMCGDNVTFIGEEECDKGINGISGDGCYDDCTNVTYNSIYCGDGVLFPINESCDDGNLINHDGCSNICKKESYSNTFCGDNILFVGFEDCDDGNKISGDECSSTCDFEYCGDGILTPSFGEKCDDANPIVGDGCSMNCTIETYNTSMCGDGIIFPGYEECDDHNLDSGDGCSNTCTLETAYNPSMCGDGSLFPGFEQCDDGNKISNDGCSNNCLFETCTNGVNLNVYSVTDISGSMTIKECADTRPFYCCLFNDCDIANTCINTCHGTYYQRMDLAQRANKAFIENLFKVSGNEVGLVTYATVSNDTGYHELSNNSVSLINTIDSWASYGRTCICCGVLNAIDKMVNESDSSAYKVLVVMSDGEANIQCLDKYPSLSSENAAIQASCDAYEDYGIVVHTVGFGADAGKKTLQKMADCGHGRYYSGDFDLVDVYKQISQDIMLNMSCNVCGNGILESGEECDDNNSINGDGCSSICKNETICGNGIKEFPEECDDKNLINGDGCSNVCILQPEVYWLNSNGVRITQAHVGDTVKLILNNSGLNLTGPFNFEIFEKDSFLNPDDNIRTGTGGISGVFSNVGFGNVLGNWTITEEDYAKTDVGDYDGFYFTINGYKSNNLTILTRDLTEECKYYVDEFSCNSCDNSGCIAAEKSVNKKVFEAYPEVWGDYRCGDEIIDFNSSCIYKIQCKCVWDDILNSCSYSWELVPLNCTPDIGACTYSESTADTCDDGFLGYSWTTIWTWGTDNGYADFNDGPSNDINDYFNMSINGSNTYFYDPLKISRNCVGGSNTILCPAKVQLPFFGFYNLIITIFIIAGIYYLIYLRKLNTLGQKRFNLLKQPQ